MGRAPFFARAKHENPVSLTFFAPQPHGNACYAGRVQSQNNLIVPHMKNITSLPNVLIRAQLRVVCIIARKYIECIWESPTSEDTHFHRHRCSFAEKMNRTASNMSMLTVTASFLSDLFISSAVQGLFQVFFGPTGVCSHGKIWFDFSSTLYKICRYRTSILLSL